MKSLEGRVAVVTGAGSGIGAAAAAALAGAGCAVACADVDSSAAERTARSLEAQGRLASAHAVDVADARAVQVLATDVVRTHRRVDVLVNNAGVTVLGAFAETDVEDARHVMDVNVMGMVACCRAFLPHLRERDEAHIVNVSSIFGLLAPPRQVLYAASKFAIRGFSAGLRAELAPDGIGVTTVFPGNVRTRIVEHARATAESERLRAASLVARNAIPPERVATSILEAIARNRARAFVGRGTRLVDTLCRLAPAATQALAARIDARLG